MENKINRIELLGLKGLSQKESLAFEAFVKNGVLINLDEDIIIETILLRKEYPIKLPDAIIAATCIVNSLTLISNNSKDFEKVKGLSLYRI
jgi:predicted nucleic acid-binding protein